MPERFAFLMVTSKPWTFIFIGCIYCETRASTKLIYVFVSFLRILETGQLIAGILHLFAPFKSILLQDHYQEPTFDRNGQALPQSVYGQSPQTGATTPYQVCRREINTLQVGSAQVLKNGITSFELVKF